MCLTRVLPDRIQHGDVKAYRVEEAVDRVEYTGVSDVTCATVHLGGRILASTIRVQYGTAIDDSVRYVVCAYYPMVQIDVVYNVITTINSSLYKKRVQKREY